jgi:peptidyl-prolyl cis-trans isomerase B (cyclophilin B)
MIVSQDGAARALALGTCLALTLASLPACQKKTAFEKVREDVSSEPEKDPVQLTVTAPRSDVPLGDDIALHFKLTNSGKSRVTVNVPRIDQRSVTLRVRMTDGNVAMISRNHATTDMQTGQFIPEAGEAKELAAGESLEKDVTTPAILAGKLVFTASYVRQGAPSALVAPPVEVTVTPADPQKGRLGVTIDTTEGPYSAVFRPDVAYNTVESFVSLAKRGFYTGLKFHRVMKGFMAQGGDPTGTGNGDPGYFLPLEARPDKLPHTRGVMSMARRGEPQDSAGSQFFILFATRTDLDSGGYTTFAQMTSGEETLKKLEDVPTTMNEGGEQAKPIKDVLIKRVVVAPVP